MNLKPSANFNSQLMVNSNWLDKSNVIKSGPKYTCSEIYHISWFYQFG